MSKYFARCRVHNADQARDGFGVSNIHKTGIVGHVLVYRPKSGRRESLFTVPDISGNETTVFNRPHPHQEGSGRLLSSVIFVSRAISNT